MDVRMVIASWPQDAPRGAVAVFCRRHGISRSRFYEVRAEAVKAGPLAVVSPKPRFRPDLATPAGVEAAALRIRKELAEDGWDHGPISVGHAMAAAGLPAPSRATLARIFTRHGAVVPQPQKRPHASYRSFVFGQVHECWQLDATQWRLADGSPAVVFQLLDDHSRYIVASVVAEGETSAAAAQVMTAAVARFQAPVLLLSDNGLAMNPHRRGKTSQLAAYAASLGTRPITSRIYHPQTCGKNERLHSTLKRFLRQHPRPATLAELEALVAQFDDHYNRHRPHQALGMRCPADVLATGPLAIPPIPPEPASPAQTNTASSQSNTASQSNTTRRARRTPSGPAQPQDQMQIRRVSKSGTVKARYALIGLGTEWAGSDVLALIEPPTISIFDLHGTELRTITITPGTDYYGTGRPAGGRRRTRINAQSTQKLTHQPSSPTETETSAPN